MATRLGRWTGLGAILVVTCFVLAWLLPGPAHAGAWPSKAIQLVVSFAPGGGSDVAARVVAKYLSEELKVPVNVINKAGGNQIPAIKYVLDAPPDGYILLQEQQANSAIKAFLKDLPFKIEDRTFGPMIVSGPNAVVVSGKSPWKTLKEALAAAKKDPGSFTWVRTGGSSFTDMVTMQLFDLAGVDVSKTKPVDFTGVGPGHLAVAGGHVLLGGGGAASVVSLVQSGDLRCLAVTGGERLTALPNCPSATEAGFPEAYLVNWYGISGPMKLPREVLDRLDKAVQTMCKNPVFAKDLESIASYPLYKSPAEFREFALKEAELYKKLAERVTK